MQEESVQPQKQDGKSLEELLAEAQAKIEQQRDTMMRAVADAENARKRAQAEATAARKYALESFAEGLLPVVDSLEAASKSNDLSGIQLTMKQLQSALEKSGVREIAPAPGERFDPHRHQAMAAVESESEPNTVVALMQKGYALYDRVLRPALVSVAKPVEKRGDTPISDQEAN
jgi:molecular chaperone GrpE